MRSNDAGVERTDLWQGWRARSDNMFFAKSREMRERRVVFIGEVHGRRSDASIRDKKTNRKTTRVVCHKCSWATCQNFVYLTTYLFNHHPTDCVTVYSAFQPSSQLSLSPFMSIFQPSTHVHRSVSLCLFDHHPNWPPLQLAMDQKEWRGQLKRIKTRPDGPGQMGLMDLYPWAEEKASPSPI